MRTFDIRFARSQGLAGLFEAPANNLGWRGAGRLSIDATGVSVALKRGLLTAFSRASRRFATDSLTEAYREGNSLQLVFKSKDRSEVLPVWTRGDGHAAELVKLLPTLRTVEFDQAVTVHRFRPDWARIWLVVLVLIAGSAASFSFLRKSSISSDEFSSIDARPVAADTSITGDDRDVIAGNPAQAARSPSKQTDGSMAAQPRSGGNPTRSEAADADYQGSSRAVDSKGRPGATSSVESQSSTATQDVEADIRSSASYRQAAAWMLEIFEAQSGNGIDDEGWWQFTVRLHTTPEFQGRELWVVREAMLAVSRAWRAHDVEFAQELTGQVHMLIRGAL